MPIQSLCTVVEAVKLNPNAIALTLEAPELVKDMAAGQFVHIKCGHSRLLRRPISICDFGGDRFRVVFEVRGSGTDWLARREVGDRLDVLGPLGRGFRVEPGDRPLLVGGGIGVPPMLSCAERAGGGYAVLGFRDADHALLTDELRAVCGETLVATEDGSVGYKGFVTTGAAQILDTHPDVTAVLACGPRPMLNAVWAEAQKRGIPCQVSMEERMACGVGACLGCAIELADGSMRHVCKDGPVFDAAEVKWNG